MVKKRKRQGQKQIIAKAQDKMFGVLRKKADDLGYSSRYISKNTGISQPTVWRIISGKAKRPQYNHVIKISNLLDIDAMATFHHFWTLEEQSGK